MLKNDGVLITNLDEYVGGIMPSISRVQISWKTSGFTIRTNINRITDCTMETSSDNMEEAAGKERLIRYLAIQV